MKKFLLSDESINSYGFKVLTDGIDLSAFKNNPVMLYEHERTNLIGTWKNLTKDGGKLMAEPGFDTEDELASKIEGKVNRGILKGASIGIQILKFREETTEDGAIVPVVLKSKLVEASITALPSNYNALRLYNQQGELMSESDITLTVREVKQQSSKNNTDMKINSENLKALGLQENSSEEQLNKAISGKLSELNTLKQEQENLHNQQAEELVNSAITAGKLSAGQKDSFLKLAKADLENTRQVLSNMSAPKKPGDMINPETTEGREDWTLSDWRKKDPKGLLKLKHENPSEYKAMLGKSDVSKHL